VGDGAGGAACIAVPAAQHLPPDVVRRDSSNANGAQAAK
jgi:hypothetical protein